MASEAQYEFFKSVYEEENERHTELESRAKLYITIVTFYIGAIAFHFKDVLEFTETLHIPASLYVATAVVLLSALLLTILAIRIRTFEGVCDLKKTIESFGEEPLSDALFLDARLVDYAVATEFNSGVNDKIARLLAMASWLLFVSVGFQLAIFVLAILKQ